MEYREIAPGPSLRPFVATFWTLQGVQPEARFDLVLPDGHAELVVHRSGRFREWQASGDVSEQSPALVAGVMERAIALAPAPRFETVGVRLAPHGLAPLCRHPLSVLGGRLTPAVDALSPAFSRIVADAGQADSLAEALRILELELARLFARVAPAPDTVAAAVRLIARTGGTISMDRLIRSTGATSRQLERQFQACVGIPPKRYARLVRFQRAVSALVSAPRAAGAELAVRHGYYDQAHFTRDFRAFTGWAPRAFAAQKLSELTKHFVSDSSKTAPAAHRDTGCLEDA
jgi:AraC-like DNA-binding protein